MQLDEVTNNDHPERVLEKHIDKKFHRFMPNNLVVGGVDVLSKGGMLSEWLHYQ
jgi:hypothetical protein